MAAQDKKQNDKENETVIAGGTPSAPPTFARADSTTARTVIAAGQTNPYRAIAGALTVGSNDVQDAMLGPDGIALPSSGETLPEQATARMILSASAAAAKRGRGPFAMNTSSSPCFRLEIGILVARWSSQSAPKSVVTTVNLFEVVLPV